jgi:PAS domain S-box-containing protein
MAVDKDQYLEQLRKKAEDVLHQRRRKEGNMSSAEVQEIIHEQQVYQTELELQNESLQRARSSLEESRKRYFDLFNLAPIGYVTINEDSIIEEANLTFTIMIDRDVKEVLNKKLASFVAPASQDTFYLHVRRALESRSKQSSQITLKGDKEIQVRIISSPVEENRRLYVRSALIDITDEQRSKRQLDETTARFESVLDQMPSGIIMVEAHTGKIIMSNGALERIFRHSFPPSSNIKEYQEWGSLHPDLRPLGQEEHQMARALLMGETTPNEELVIRRGDGTLGTILSSTSPVRNEMGNIIGAVAVITDITDRKTLEWELGRRNQELARSNDELQQFAYVASHDLQEPLRMVTAYLSLLEKKYGDQLDPKGKSYITFAVEGGKRMRALIDDLLEYSRVETMGKPLAVVNMTAVVNDTIRSLKAPIEETRAEIAVDPMPTIIADGAQMTQVMQNLIENAIRFHGDERPQIHITATIGEKEWTFAVKDNGIGVNPAYQDRMFQIFQRLHSKEKYPGTGVGLAIVKRIIDRHGGRVWVESEEGKGATFYFTIPRSRGAMNDE